MVQTAIAGSILAIGAAPFAMQVAASLVNVIMNTGLNRYGGDIAVSGMGIVSSITTLILMPLFGINQGLQPLSGTITVPAGMIGSKCTEKGDIGCNLSSPHWALQSQSFFLSIWSAFSTKKMRL